MNFELDSQSRPSYPVPSTHHQTLLSKTLFDYHSGALETIAAVALASKSIQNSSLAANFAFNAVVDRETIKLFSTVFHPASALPIQFVPELSLDFQTAELVSGEETSSKESNSSAIVEFVQHLVKDTKYFDKSIQCLTIRQTSSKVDIIESIFAIHKDGVLFVLIHLETLKIVSDVLTETEAELIMAKSPNLKCVEIKCRNTVEDKNLSDLTKLSRCIQTLDLSFCVQATCVGLLSVAKFTNLKSLHLQVGPEDASWFFDEGVIVTLPYLKCLEVLNMEGLYRIGDKTLRCIGENLSTCLRVLNISHCPRMTDEGIGWMIEGENNNNLANLVELNVIGNQLITDVGMEKICRGLPNLTSLSFGDRGTSGITDEGTLEKIPLHLHKLRSLRIEHCNKITDEGIKKLCETSAKFSRNLEALNVEHCIITDDSVEAIRRHLPCLTSLRLCRTEISDDALDLVEAMINDSRLIKLDVRGNQNLSSERLDALASKISPNCIFKY